MPDPVLVRPNKKPYSFSKLAEEVKSKEGFVAKPYKDSKGYWTIGYGSLIGDGSDAAYKKSPYYTGKITMGKSGIAKKADLSGKSVTEETAKAMMMKSITDKASRAIKSDMLGDKFFDLSPDLQDAAISSVYRGGLSGSPKTMENIREGKFTEAAKEFLDNDEYKAAKESGSGVASRMELLANLLKEEAKKKASFAERVEQRVNE
jgi:GH24 family phage-related lysozyme (muramidase)